ncbi:MAG TPA: hypothetical protein VF535_11570 [Allosphingosinicella sp.]
MNVVAKVGQMLAVASGVVILGRKQETCIIAVEDIEFELNFVAGNKTDANATSAGGKKVVVTLTGFDSSLGTSYILPQVAKIGENQITFALCVHGMGDAPAVSRQVSYTVYSEQ